MALTEAYTNTNGTWGTEYSLTAGSTSIAAQTADGVFQVFLDLNALAIGDVYEFRCYEKTRAGDAQRVCFYQAIAHAQGVDGALWVSPPLQLMHGWDFSLKRTAGSDRTILSSVRSAA